MARFLGALLLCLAAALPAAAQESRAADETPLPLTTERAPTIPRGAAVLEAYAEYLDTHAVPFVSPEGSLLRAPVVSLRYGAADNVEFQVEGAAQVWGFADEDDEKVEDEHEVGDFTLWTKWLALKEKKKRPAVALRWGVKLPNASDESGLGTDETDVFGSVVVSKRLGKKTGLDANLGVAILGDPTEARRQNDVLTYGASLTRIMSKNTALLMEVAGTSGKGHAPPRSVARLGFKWFPYRSRFHFFAAGLAGLTSRSPDWGALVGAGRAFHRKAK
ncbi:MAG: transporter [Acidobacteriota bacterium]|nr:MAG: transporter [Acidobacteriota bacterium]